MATLQVGCHTSHTPYNAHSVLSAMVNGQTTQEVTQLNIESLWSGGPFQDPVSEQASGPHVVIPRPWAYISMRY